jgi:hypothetical protein
LVVCVPALAIESAMLCFCAMNAASDGDNTES